MKRLIPLLLTLILLLASCAPAWDGYENTDLSKFITLGEYKGLSYTIIEVAVTDEDVENAIESILADNMVKTPITDRVSEKNDYAIIDYTTSVAEGKISALSGTDKTVAVGSSYTLTEIPGFSESLIGKSQGETYTFTLTFAADYTNANISDIKLVAGKEATVEVTIDSLFTYEKPELNDELVQKLSKTAKTVEEYRAEIRTQLEDEAKASADASAQEELWAQVLEKVTVLHYPKSEIKAYADEMQSYYEDYAEYYGYTFEEFLASAYKLTPKEFEQKKQEYAESSVLSDMTLYAIAAAEGITVTKEEYAAGLTRYFELTGAELGITDEASFEEYYGEAMIRQSILWDEVSVFLYEQGKGVEGPAETEAESKAE